jgi:hypothetical protein
MRNIRALKTFLKAQQQAQQQARENAPASSSSSSSSSFASSLVDIEQRGHLGRSLLVRAVVTGDFYIHLSKLLTGHGNVLKLPDPQDVRKPVDSFALYGMKIRRYPGLILEGGTTYNRTLFDALFFEWNVQLVDVLLAHGAVSHGFEALDRMRNSPLHYAAYYGNVPALKSLLGTSETGSETEGGTGGKSGAAADLDQVNLRGFTPLQLAAIGNHKAAQEVLVAAGAKTAGATGVDDMSFYGNPATIAGVGAGAAGAAGVAGVAGVGWTPRVHQPGGWGDKTAVEGDDEGAVDVQVAADASTTTSRTTTPLHDPHGGQHVSSFAKQIGLGGWSAEIADDVDIGFRCDVDVIVVGNETVDRPVNPQSVTSPWHYVRSESEAKALFLRSYFRYGGTGRGGREEQEVGGGDEREVGGRS